MLGARCGLVVQQMGSLLSGVYNFVYPPVTEQTLSQEYLQTQLDTGYCLLLFLIPCFHPHYPNNYFDIYRY